MGKTIISESEVRHTANLAKLALKSKDVGKFKDQLSNIFEYIDQIGEMKTKGVKVTSQTTQIKNRFREDKINKKLILPQKQALSGAKKIYKGYFVAKSVFGK